MTIYSAYNVINFSVIGQVISIQIVSQPVKVEENVNCLYCSKSEAYVYAYTTSIWLRINMQKSKSRYSDINSRFIPNFCFSQCNNVRLKS